MRVRDLPIAGRATRLVWRKRRYRCVDCSRTFTETHEQLPARRRVTVRFRARLAERVVGGAAHAEVAREEHTSRYQVACALLQADQVEDGERLAVDLAEELTPHARSDHPSLVSVAGALWLIAAIAAARRTDRTEAWARIDRADALAGLLGEDGNHAWTAFGPTNVAIHRVSVAAELGDAGEALHAATAVDLDRLPSGLLSRRAQVNLDLAWAQAQRRRDAEATLHLLEAERIAPQVIRHNVIAQEIVREMLARGNRAQTQQLSLLARRAGLLQ